MIKVVFYGSGKFADVILKGILSDGRFQILAVISQPARPTGRNREITETPVSMTARANNILLYQPENLADFNIPEIQEADLGVVAQYGLIMPKRIIDAPKFQTLNLHASLLPAYRGASPIQSALLNGEVETGVTLMLMDEKMDHGPILGVQKTAIAPDETQTELFNKLSIIARGLFLRLAPEWVTAKISTTPQDHSNASYCKILTKEDGRVDFTNSARQIYNQWRAMDPWPGIWSTIQGKRIKFVKIEVSDKIVDAPGLFLFDNSRLFIGCGNNSSVSIVELQKEGKNIQTAVSFINGNINLSGKKFDEK